MLRSAASKVMWVGRATVFMVGLSVIVAVVLGAATTALGATGQSFILGRSTNTAETPTALTSTLADAAKSALIVANKSGGPALDLRVGNSGAIPPIRANSVAPMKVNSSKVVTNLNADKLDNLDSTALMRASTYEVDTFTDNSTTLPNTIVFVKCDLGDKILSGGYSGLEPDEGTVTQDRPLVTNDGKEAWQVSWRNGGVSESGVQVIAWCADFPPAHTP